MDIVVIKEQNSEGTTDKLSYIEYHTYSTRHNKIMTIIIKLALTTNTLDATHFIQ